MFQHRPNKILLKKRYENRAWKKGESLSEYLRDKAILANQVPIAKEERMDGI